jgi:hypothetical protein
MYTRIAKLLDMARHFLGENNESKTE